MADSKTDLGILGFFLYGPKPPKSIGELFWRLSIIIVILGLLYFIGMAMLQSFIDGFQA